MRESYDLVVCLYVHVAGSVDEMVRRMASGVARGGTLFMVGHCPRAAAGSGVDAVIRARRVS